MVIKVYGEFCFWNIQIYKSRKEETRNRKGERETKDERERVIE